jgi:cyclase
MTKQISKPSRFGAILGVLAALASPQAAGAAQQGAVHLWAADPPAAFIAPPLDPTGVTLATRELAPGVYALLSGEAAVDNSGFVVGEREVLVIDAHINGTMARQIQAAVARVTHKPIRYLVNTNYHGDHTFGNYAFPAETTIIAHRETAARMVDFEAEKALMLRTVNNDPAIFAEVRPRLPDLTFDERLRIDLGGRVVEVHHFGPGNTPGDTVVYVPEAKVAWTGNLVVGEGTIPPIFEGGPGAYLETIARFRRTLPVETIVPGHGAPTTGATLGRYLTYLSGLMATVRAAAGAGLSEDQAVAGLALDDAYLPPADSPFAALAPFLSGIHALNVQLAYRELNGK